MSTYNWSQMHEEATTILEGEFDVTIIKAEKAFSSTGKDMIKVKAKVESGRFAGREMFTQFTVSPESPQAMRMFFMHMKVFGLDDAFFAQIEGKGLEVVAANLEGRRAIACVEKDNWNGQDREKIKAWKPALGGHGGGALIAGLGVSVGAGSSSSFPGNHPSPSSYDSSPAVVASSAPVMGEQATTSQEAPGEPAPPAQPSSPAPVLSPGF